MAEDKGPEAVEELLAEAEKAGKGAKMGAGKRGARKTAQRTRKSVVVEDVEGPVTVIDQSVNVLGDANTAAGSSALGAPAPGAIELMGTINVAIDEIYRSFDQPLGLDEIGRMALERHTAILAACQHEEEYPHAVEIMKLRIRRMLSEKGEHDDGQ